MALSGQAALALWWAMAPAYTLSVSAIPRGPVIPAEGRGSKNAQAWIPAWDIA
jgi:hypothetical protein